MDNQADKTRAENRAARDPGQDPMVRMHCLELASRLPNVSHHTDVVRAAEDYLKFVGAAPTEPPMKSETEIRVSQLEHIARIAHEVNRAYCQALGDNSQPAWEDAPEWQRASARMGVDLHLSGDFGPEASHISWSNQKLAEGWKYGPVKDPENKEHPCLVPFADLPREQQAKDFLFRGVVHAFKKGGA